MLRPPNRWHEHARRCVCRVVFLAVCVLPTVAVCGWIVWHRQAGHHAAWQERLGWRLGARVSAARVSYPLPDTSRWHDVTLADMETGEPLLQAATVEASSFGETTTLIARDVEVDADRLPNLSQLLGGLLRRADQGPLRITASNVRLRGTTGDFPLSELVGSFTPSATGNRATLEFNWGKTTKSGQVRLAASRNRQTSPPSTQLELGTGEAVLPSRLIRDAGMPLADLGGDAKFCGYYWATESAGRWQGELAGQLTDVDLSRVASVDGLNQLNGKVTLSVDRARVSEGRLQEAAGELSITRGQIDKSLYVRLITRSGCHAVPVTAVPWPMEYDELAVRFDLDSSGMKLFGACRDVPIGTLLARDSQPLMITPKTAAVSVAQFIEILTPGHGGSAVASREAQSLASVLPLPAAEDRQTARRE